MDIGDDGREGVERGSGGRVAGMRGLCPLPMKIDRTS